jgi:hypothetical protein
VYLSAVRAHAVQTPKVPRKAKEGKSGRLDVLTGFAQDHRERNYTVIPEASMKQTMQDWIIQAGEEDIKNMTQVVIDEVCTQTALWLVDDH